jgi:hypothetical protein
VAKGVRATATGESWRKHEAPRSWNKQAIKRTRNSFARFKPGIPDTPIQIAELYNNAEVTHSIPSNADDQVSNYWVEMQYVVGASAGKETRYVLIKYNAGRVHARPVTFQELRNNFGADNL